MADQVQLPLESLRFTRLLSAAEGHAVDGEGSVGAADGGIEVQWRRESCGVWCRRHVPGVPEIKLEMERCIRQARWRRWRSLPAVGGARAIWIRWQGYWISFLPAVMRGFSVVPPDPRVAVDGSLWIGRWARMKYLRLARSSVSRRIAAPWWWFAVLPRLPALP